MSKIPSTFLTNKKAAQFFDVSERTLKRHVKAGKISFTRDERGWNYFDPIHLEQKYGARQKPVTDDGIGQNGKMARVDPQNTVSKLQQRVTDLERANEELRKDKEDFRKDKDTLLGIIEKQTLFLNPPENRKTGFFGRVFGR